MAEYQLFKLDMVDLFDVSRDGFHIILGFAVFLLVCYLFKIRLTSWKALIAPLIFSVLLETLDARDSLAFGRAIDYWDSLHDTIITTLLPALTVVYMKYMNRGE
ncbi:MAG: hypothetical protein AAB581_01010 [Patescibacteria group bacterium]